MREVIAKLRKNAFEEIQIALDDYTGTERIDLRVFARTGEEPEPVPTRKGASVPREELPWLIDAIDQAARTSPGKDGNHALRRNGGQVRVTRSEYKGTQLVDVRYYFKDAEGQVRPTQKGVSIGINVVDEVLRALRMAEDLPRRG